MELDKKDVDLLIGLVQGRINAARTNKYLDGAERGRLVNEYEIVLHKLMQATTIRAPFLVVTRALEELLAATSNAGEMVTPENEDWNRAYDACQYAFGFAGIAPQYNI